MINKIVSESKGAYTHDNVFELDANFAYSLLLYYYERDLYQERAEAVRQELRNK